MSDRPRPASTVVLLRDGELGLELLMARRSIRARFMAGAWVFPGGAVDAEDAATPIASTSRHRDPAWAAAALREAAEELGIWITTTGTFSGPPISDVYAVARERGWVLDVAGLVWFANWVTPLASPRRFDTRFFATAADAEPHVDGSELTAAEWITPAEALRRAAEDAWLVAFPTMHTLERFSGFTSTEEALNRLRTRSEIPRVMPRLLVERDMVKILLPGDDGFEAAAAAQTDPTLYERIRVVAQAGGDVPAEMRNPPEGTSV